MIHCDKNHVEIDGSGLQIIGEFGYLALHFLKLSPPKARDRIAEFIKHSIDVSREMVGDEPMEEGYTKTGYEARKKEIDFLKMTLNESEEKYYGDK